MTNHLPTFESCLLAACSLSLALGCAKVAAPQGGGTGNSGGGNSSGTGNNSGTGNHGAGGSGVVPDSGMNGDGACQMANYQFAPKIPNVLVLVDGSGSMFQVGANLPNGAWGALRTAVLPVIQSLQLTPDGQPQIDFGLGVFTGVAPSMCPIFKTVPIAPSNYTAIMGQYPSGPLSTMKLETPVTQVLPMLPPLFTSAPGNGGNFVLFVTDGEPDFCDDGNAVCPVDAVGRRAQTAQRSGHHDVRPRSLVELEHWHLPRGATGVCQRWREPADREPMRNAQRVPSNVTEVPRLQLHGTWSLRNSGEPQARRWSTTPPPVATRWSSRPTSPISRR